MVRRLFLLVLAIVLERTRLRTGISIVIYDKLLGVGNASASMMSVLDIFERTLSASMTIVAGGEGRVMPRAVATEG